MEAVQFATPALQAALRSKRAQIELERTLVTILENKPFGLPLSAGERMALDALKADVLENSETSK